MQHLDSAKEPEIVFIPVDVNSWWTEYRRWMSNRAWHPQQERHHFASSSDESVGPQKNSKEAQGTVWVPNKPPKEAPWWYADYIELKAILASGSRETSAHNYLEESELQACP